MMEISIGKLRGLQQISTSRGGFSWLALDQRNNLRQALGGDDPQAVSAAMMSAFKREVIASVAGAASCALLDPEFGAAQCISDGSLPGTTGLMVAVEATGYTGDPTARRAQVLPGWSVAKAKRMGATAVKLLVYYHPDAPSAGEVEALVRQIAAESIAEDIVLCVEPLSYPLDPAVKKVSGPELQRVVLESARRLVVPGVDVLKAEFPIDRSLHPDEADWQAACAALTAASPAPWVLLSAGVNFETYVRQVRVACRAGASGVAAGRAVWKEATSLQGAGRADFLTTVAVERMHTLTALVNAEARTWTRTWTGPHVDEGWYATYQEKCEGV
jgi:tagatose-1,6-bisphosphate aldolase